MWYLHAQSHAGVAADQKHHLRLVGMQFYGEKCYRCQIPVGYPLLCQWHTSENMLTTLLVLRVPQAESPAPHQSRKTYPTRSSAKYNFLLILNIFNSSCCGCTCVVKTSSVMLSFFKINELSIQHCYSCYCSCPNRQELRCRVLRPSQLDGSLPDQKQRTGSLCGK